MAAHHVPLVGINLGHLGFLTDISADALEPMMTALLEGGFTEEPRLLLDAEIRRGDKTIFSTVAFNDVVFSRGAMGTQDDEDPNPAAPPPGNERGGPKLGA